VLNSEHGNITINNAEAESAHSLPEPPATPKMPKHTLPAPPEAPAEN